MRERIDISDGISIIEEIIKSGKQGVCIESSRVCIINVVYRVARGKGKESRSQRGS